MAALVSARLHFLFFLHLLPLAVGSGVQDTYQMRRSWCESQTVACQSSPFLRMAERLLLCSPANAQVTAEEILTMAETASEGSSPAGGQGDKQP